MVGATSTQIMEFVCLAHANLYDERKQLTSLASLGMPMTIIPSSLGGLSSSLSLTTKDPPPCLCTENARLSWVVYYRVTSQEILVCTRSSPAFRTRTADYSFSGHLALADTQLLAYASHTARMLHADTQLLRTHSPQDT